MSVFTPINQSKEAKVHNSQYIKTENESGDEATKPAEPTNPEQPESK